MDDIQRHIDEATRAAREQHLLNKEIIEDHLSHIDQVIAQLAALTASQVGAQIARDASANPTVTI